MSLHIKNTEAHELARLTGESMTKTVTEAIRERLERSGGVAVRGTCPSNFSRSDAVALPLCADPSTLRTTASFSTTSRGCRSDHRQLRGVPAGSYRLTSALRQSRPPAFCQPLKRLRADLYVIPIMYATAKGVFPRSNSR